MTLVLLSGLPVLFADTWLAGVVIDDAQGTPIPHAEIQVRERLIETVPDGGQRLLPLDAAAGFAALTGDEQGRFAVRLDRPPAYLQIDVQAAGYFGATLALVPVAPEQTNQVRASLSPERMSAHSLTGLNTFAHETGRSWATDQGDAAPSAAHPDQEEAPRPLNWGVGAFPWTEVPQQVLVSNLAGTGFTGWIDLDELIAGTVTAEMNDGFPLEALKAQAVAARTFALDRWRRRGVANGGQAYNSSLGNRSRNATWNTRSIVLLYESQVMPAYYSARCNGDYTLDSEQGPTLANCRPGGLGAGKVGWARSRPCSGHANCLTTGEACCAVVIDGHTNYVYGHGIGLCQRGAQQFAGLEGWSWDQILTNYYTDISLANLPVDALNLPITTTTTVNLRSAPCGALITTLPSGSVGVVIGGPQRPACPTLAAPYRHLTWWQLWFPSGAQGWMAEDYFRRVTTPAFLPLPLSHELNAGQLRLSWPAGGPLLVVQVSAEVGPAAAWTDHPATVRREGDRWVVEPTLAAQAQFFRLRLR
jgi:hypothetical protein